MCASVRIPSTTITPRCSTSLHHGRGGNGRSGTNNEIHQKRRRRRDSGEHPSFFSSLTSERRGTIRVFLHRSMVATATEQAAVAAGHGHRGTQIQRTTSTMVDCDIVDAARRVTRWACGDAQAHRCLAPRSQSHAMHSCDRLGSCDAGRMPRVLLGAPRRYPDSVREFGMRSETTRSSSGIAR